MLFVSAQTDWTLHPQSYVAEGSGEPLDLTLTRSALSSVLLGSSKSERTASTSASEATIISGADSVRVHSSKRKKGKHVAADEPSLAEQVEQLGLATEDAEAPKGSALAGVGAPRSGSLAHMLAQALHSNDKSLLEQCLSTTNETVVRNTITRLPPALAVRFLTDVVGKLEAKPSRGVTLMVWIRAILLIHTSYLMTVPDLPDILSGLYSLADARLAVFPRLLKLTGRLDLLLSQIELKSQGSTEDASKLQTPITSFVDEDDSDNDEDDDDDDDEMDGMGADSGDEGWDDVDVDEEDQADESESDEDDAEEEDDDESDDEEA